MSRETFPCPKCNRILAKCGQLVAHDRPELLDVFQCDECTATWVFGGEPFETALTFLVGNDGIPLHNETQEPLKFD